jgi:single-strand DNA-binding protein
VDKPNYFDVTVWGAQAESCATYLQKGRGVAIDGRLEWREWEPQDGSGKRHATSIVAERVQFLGTRDAAEGDGRAAPESDVPGDAADFEQAATGGGVAGDDLPF